MKKGLNVTLMTVAIAVMALQAMAMAPVIGEIKSPVVGNESGATAATAFVYPDAFDINSMATDDTTPIAADIRWSYYIEGTPIYRINDVAPVTLSDAEINDPQAKRINGTTEDPADVDGNAATITIRNLKYAPLTGSATATASGAGIVDSQVVTLFASDGTTYSSKDVIFYTDDGGNDRLSPGGYQTVYDPPAFPGSGTAAWGYEFLVGTITSSTASGAAICLDSAALGVNYASWRSPWGVVPISKSTVYRIRARINGSQTTAGTVPFFDLVIDNYNSNTSTGLNLYGGDLMILDNEGGANAPLNSGTMATGGKTYTWYWCPAPINSTAFNAGTLWDSGNATARNMELTFRVLDVNNNAGISADTDSGALCLNDLTVEAIPYGDLTFTEAWANNNLTSTNFTAQQAIGTTVAFETVSSSGVVKLTPSGGGVDAEYAQAFPGDANKDYGTPSTLTDNYPVVWEANTLYQANWKFSAPDATSETTPWDIYWVGMDTGTNEFIALSYVTNTVGKCATPKTGTPQEYVAFMYSHSLSASTTAEFKRIRPRAEFGNVGTMVENANTGSVRIHGVTVNKVTVPN